MDVGNQFSRRTPPSILSRQYLAKLETQWKGIEEFWQQFENVKEILFGTKRADIGQSGWSIPLMLIFL